MLNLNSKLERKVVAHENVFRAVWKSLLGDEGIQGGGQILPFVGRRHLDFVNLWVGVQIMPNTNIYLSTTKMT